MDFGKGLGGLEEGLGVGSFVGAPACSGHRCRERMPCSRRIEESEESGNRAQPVKRGLPTMTCSGQVRIRAKDTVIEHGVNTPFALSSPPPYLSNPTLKFPSGNLLLIILHIVCYLLLPSLVLKSTKLQPTLIPLRSRRITILLHQYHVLCSQFRTKMQINRSDNKFNCYQVYMHELAQVALIPE